MNIQEYIASGILEDYALGLLEGRERAEVERMAAQHPEVRNELNDIEDALTQYAMAGATPLPRGLTGKVLKTIDNAPPEKLPPPAAGQRRSGLRGLLIALSLLLFAVNIWLYRENRLLRNEQELLQVSLKDCEIEKTILQNRPDGFQPRSNQPLILKDTGGRDRPIAKVFYDVENATAYLDIVGLDLPEPGKQYQVWALLPDRSPEPVGIVENDNILNSLINIEYIPGAQGFAISVENLGGSDKPTEGAILALATFI